jgi:regulatory protein
MMSNKAKNSLARLIAKRLYSESELRKKLSKHSEEEIEDAIEWGKEQGFVNDERFARAFVHDTLLLNPQGKRLLYIKLNQKGVKASISELILQEEYPDELEAEIITKIANKYVKSLKEEDNTKKLKKLCGYLLRRGFPKQLVYRTAREAVNLDISM